MKFEKIIQSRDNNFNFVRLTSALSVVFFHAYGLNTLYAGRLDPISDFLSPISNLGDVAVGVFFLLSGIFVTQSWLRDPNLLRFFLRRAVRIMPALFVCVTATTLIAVTFFSQQGIAGLMDIAPWRYIGENTLLHRLKTAIPAEEIRITGVYYRLAERDMNGPLWTLYWEGRIYVLLGIAGAASILPARRWIGVVSAFFLIAVAVRPDLVSGYVWELSLLSLFMSGVMLCTFADRIRLGGRAIVCLLIYALVLRGASAYVDLFIAVAAIAIWLGSSTKLAIPHIQRYDYSYAIYIYHVPVMQMIRMKVDPIGPVELFMAALMIVLPISLLSWHLVEQPALSWMRKRLAGQWLVLMRLP